jgi:plasmid stabilization system protein ParE
MIYELLLVPKAEAEVDRIIRYLSERSPQGARAWCERWEQVLADLRNDPLTFGLAPESSAHPKEVRQVLFKTRRGRKYRALFTIVGRGVYIIEVRGPGQKLVPRDQIRRRS